MALTESTVINRIEVLEDGQLDVRMVTKIFSDASGSSVEVSRSYHRHVVVPGDDLSGEDARVRAIGGVEHTDAVIAAYRAAQEAARA